MGGSLASTGKVTTAQCLTWKRRERDPGTNPFAIWAESSGRRTSASAGGTVVPQHVADRLDGKCFRVPGDLT
jgi:hypothetical protein